MNKSDKNIDIQYSDGRFLIRCPMYANNLLIDMPSRKWSKSGRVWVAPGIRRNAEYIEKRLLPYANLSPAAVRAIADAKEFREMPTEGFPASYTFKSAPRVHQMTALNKMWGKSAFALHMDRGTGKSKTYIDYACALRLAGEIEAVIIVVKLSLRLNWVGYDRGTGPGEREGFEGHSTIKADCFLPEGGSDKKFDKWLMEEHDFPVLIMGMESMSQGGAFETLKRFIFKYNRIAICIDESHMVANHKAIRTERMIEAARMCDYRTTLTGTPISQAPMNLFSQFEFLDPEIMGIGSYYAFKNRYAVMGGYRHPKTGQYMEVVGYQNLEELAKLVAPYVYECRKQDVLAHLPPKSYERRYVTLTPEQRALYNQIKREEAYEWSGKEVVVQNVLELSLRLHQVAGGFVTTFKDVERLKRDGSFRIKRVSEWHEVVSPDKNPKIKEIIDLAEADKQQIIWCAYRPEIEAVVCALELACPGVLVRQIHGGISESDRNVFKDEFQSGKAKFLVSNTQTGGTGLTLTAAEQMIYYNNTQKMVDRQQSEDRAHREGLQHPVHYIDLIASKTIDEAIIKSIEAKMDLAEYIRTHIREAGILLDGG